MNKITNEESVIINNLKYMGLDLENLPEFLLNYTDVNYKPTKVYDDNNFKVYRYINIRDIQILLTPNNRLNSLSEKYSKATHISNYLDTSTEENLIRNATFLKMIQSMNIQEIEKIEKEQKQFNNEIPFKVKYEDNYLWEIYFSEFTGKYFMMVTTEDLNYNALFYIIKKQIECRKNNKDEYIFVPISYIDYTTRYLKKSEISDLEKYIWIFTKQWPQIYEVFDKNNELAIHIVGVTDVYDKIKSFYKLKLNTKEEAIKFYQLLKALFILKTELPFFYNFEATIGENGDLTFEYNSKIISLNMLSKFIKDEYKKHAEELNEVFKEKEELENKLEKLLLEEKNKNLEYIFREKQVATYMECRNSVFGRIRYFLKGKNNKFKKKKEENIIKENENISVEKEISRQIIEEKELYTIEDLIKISLELNRIITKNKNIRQDINGLTNKIEKLEAKIKNAALYIEKIEEHRKSIFEFWKFTNKDEAIGLNLGKEEKIKEERKKIKAVFEYENDLEEYGKNIDKLQKRVLSKEECDAIFIANTNILYDLNRIRTGIQVSKDSFEELKKELLNQNEILFNQNDFDIFGNVKEDKTKISILGNQSHRESKKGASKIIGVSQNMTFEEYISKLLEINSKIEKAIEKIKTTTDINIYLTSDEKLNTKNIEIFNINPKNAIQKSKNSDKINLYKLILPEDIKLAYYSNIIYYDNNNHTLPDGMNVTDEVLFDMNLYKVELKRQKIFRINQDINEIISKPKIVCVYEYEIKK